MSEQHDEVISHTESVSRDRFSTDIAGNERARLAALEAKASVGNIAAAYALGTAYMLGRGVRPDRELALHWYEVARIYGHTSAEARIAALKGEPPAPAAVVDVPSPPDADALFRNAQQLEVGYQGEQDIGQALALYAQAAEQGHGQAQYALGMLTLGSRTDPRGVADAFRLLRAAANQNVPEAQFELGRLYSIGKGTPRNPSVAKAWYRKAAAQGYIPAKRSLESKKWWNFK
ncbi:hypothetical protein EC912_104310 [Luteibacter rhizovicinus]|uniref:TPR repeat protein n=1 Tax=Luteibacter rhizovicinus TaxID=242606 RepID=A0A4R3YSR2_9GAMM|nr:tetratricopeptide repeat protein [Luteibacter rhizovicinus]TCV94113.1 hypothetical protein EC912_104310 [Luteibacter rhizovicinus]